MAYPTKTHQLRQLAIYLIGLCAALSFSATLMAEPVHIAVAGNFKTTLEQLSAKYQQTSDDELIITSAATGTLYTQIRHGAPFEIFLAADTERPKLLEVAGKTLPHSRMTYALGKLAVFSRNEESGEQSITQLLEGDGRIAIANPALAPYGLAAKEVLIELGLWDDIQSRLVQGHGVSQAMQFFHTGNVDVVFGTLSMKQQPMKQGAIATNRNHTVKLVPESLYSPIAQQSVLLKSAEDNFSALAFYRWLGSQEAQQIIQDSGYGIVAPEKLTSEQKPAND